MGFVEPFKRLPELLGHPPGPDQSPLQAEQQTCVAFIGIDSPDFNLGIAKGLTH